MADEQGRVLRGARHDTFEPLISVSGIDRWVWRVPALAVEGRRLIFATVVMVPYWVEMYDTDRTLDGLAAEVCAIDLPRTR